MIYQGYFASQLVRAIQELNQMYPYPEEKSCRDSMIIRITKDVNNKPLLSWEEKKMLQNINTDIRLLFLNPVKEKSYRQFCGVLTNLDMMYSQVSSMEAMLPAHALTLQQLAQLSNHIGRILSGISSSNPFALTIIATGLLKVFQNVLKTEAEQKEVCSIQEIVLLHYSLDAIYSAKHPFLSPEEFQEMHHAAERLRTSQEWLTIYPKAQPNFCPP